MARPPRIEFPDAIYHATARGIERRAIVADDRDRQSWLDRLQRVVGRYRWRLFAFVLLDNHFHYPGYAAKAKQRAWVDYARVLADFGREASQARRAYRSFVERGLDEEVPSPFAAAWHGVLLGSESFVQRVRAALRGRPAALEVPLLAKVRGEPRPSMEDVVRAVRKRFPSDPTQWRAGSRCDALGRSVAAYVARQRTGLPVHAIAACLGYRRSSGVSMGCRRVEEAMTDPKTAELVRRVLDDLKPIDY